jgi:hypothetical protein
MRSFAGDRGYLTIAQDGEHDYLSMAYLQALSVKATQRSINGYAVLVDSATAARIEPRHRRVFDHIILLEEDLAVHDQRKFANELQVFALTPWRHTVKVEADLLFTSDYVAWWEIYKEQDMCFTCRVHDYRGAPLDDAPTRQLWRDNALPNAYTGWYAFSYSRDVFGFFHQLRQLWQNWPRLRDHELKNCRTKQAVTDELFSIALAVANRPAWLAPHLPSFVHMKSELLGLASSRPWHDQLSWHVPGTGEVFVGFHRQHLPLHYHDKSWDIRGLIERYESAAG